MYRYIGNKTKLTPWLVQRIQDLVPHGGTVADLMCGTASVSEALRVAGYRVIASDLMTYAAHHARVRLLLDGEPTFHGLRQRYPAVLQQLNNLDPIKGHFVREYSPAGHPLSDTSARSYLTAGNAGKVDAITGVLNRWREAGAISEIENSLLRHDLILAVNRVANIAGTYGHYRSSWSRSSLSELQLTPSKFATGFRTDHVVLQGRAEDLASELSADLCYLDPPYMKRQYAANYHLIETVARGDEPEAVGVSGLRPWRDQYSVFCTRTRIQAAFACIIEHMDCPEFLVSYSSDGLLSEEELSELFEPFGTVSIEKREVPRFRSNASTLGSHVDEFLIRLARGRHSRQQSLRAAGAR